MTPSALVLGIETSCDETSAAVLTRDALLGHVISSQDVHAVYGGVVPELAARAHLTRIDRVVDAALARAGVTTSDLDAVAVTQGPGLIGALLVGVAWAKALAWAIDRPLVGVHHMEAHLFAPSIEDPGAEPPFVALLVSGGHTLLLHATAWGRYVRLGGTRDDAAGEAFDKVARLLDLSYPGGPAIQALAEHGDPEAFRLPRPMLRTDQSPDDADYFDFSFSGLKTAVATLVADLERRGELDARRADVAASFQAAAVDVLVAKTRRAVDLSGCDRVLLGGGVSANRRLAEAMATELGAEGTVLRASPRLSMDNGAMIARAGLFRLGRGEVAPLDMGASASLPFPGMVDRNEDPPRPEAVTRPHSSHTV